MIADLGVAGCDIPLGRRVKNCNEAFQDKVIDFLLVCIQTLGELEVGMMAK